MKDSRNKRFLIIQTAFLGDVVLTTPLLRALATDYPGAELHVVTTPVGAGVLAGMPGITTYPYDKRKQDLRSGMQSLKSALCAQEFDGVFTVHRSPRSLMVGRMAKLHAQAELGRRAFRSLVSLALGYRTFRYPDYDDATHYVDKVMSLYPEARVKKPRPWLEVTEQDRQSVAAKLPISLNKSYAVVSPFSAWGTKMWPLERFFSVARRMDSELGLPVILVGTEAKLPPDLAQELAGTQIYDLTQRTSVGEMKALIAGAQLLLANDSAPVHVAAAFNRPTVAIFGPTVRRWGFFPLSEASTVVERSGVDCRPCSLHGPNVCPKTHFRCMRDTSVGEVFAAVSKLAAQTGNSAKNP